MNQGRSRFSADRLRYFHRLSIFVLVLVSSCVSALDATSLRALADGDLHAERVTVFGFTFRDVTGTPRLVDNRLLIPDIRSRFAGGVATCDLTVDFTAHLLTLRVEFSGVEVATFLEEMGGGADGVSGIAAGSWDMDIPLDHKDNTGHGFVSVTKADLLRLGPLSSLLLGDLNAPPGSDRAESRVTLENDRLRLRGARITAPGSTVNLLGTVGFDGTVDVLAVPYPEFAILQIIPGIGDVAAWLLSSTSSKLARARIRGTLGNPAVTIAPFAGE
jgi:hypothetical protein